MVEVEIYVDGVLRTIGGVTEATKCEEIIRKIGKTFKKRGHLSLVYKWKGINSEIPWLLPLHGSFLSIVNFLKSRFCHNAIIYLNATKDTPKQALIGNLNDKTFKGSKYVGMQNSSNTSPPILTKILNSKSFIDQKCYIPSLTLLDLKLYMNIYQKSPETNYALSNDFVISQYILILYIGKFTGRIENIEDFLNVHCFKRYLDLICQQQQPSQELHISALAAILNEEIKSQEMLMNTTSQLIQAENDASLEKVEDIKFWEQKIREKDLELRIQSENIQDLQDSIKKAQQELTRYVENRIRNFDANPTPKSIVHQSQGVWV